MGNEKNQKKKVAQSNTCSFFVYTGKVDSRLDQRLYVSPKVALQVVKEDSKSRMQPLGCEFRRNRVL